jgi:hypothetical protein
VAGVDLGREKTQRAEYSWSDTCFVNVGVPNQTPTPIGRNSSTPGLYTMTSPNTVQVHAFLAGKTPADYAGALLYVTVNALYSTPAAGYLEDYSTQIMSSTGTMSSANSAFIDPGLPYFGLRHGHVLGVTDTCWASRAFRAAAISSRVARWWTMPMAQSHRRRSRQTSPFLLPAEPYADAGVGAASDIVDGSSGAAEFAGGTVHEGLVGHDFNEDFGLAINLQSDTAQLLDYHPTKSGSFSSGSDAVMGEWRLCGNHSRTVTGRSWP